MRAAAGRALARVTGQALGPYQSAVLRIGIAGTWLFFLLRELPHRRELYGPESPWSWELGRRLIATNDAFSVLMWGSSAVWFEIVYAVAVLSAVLLLLGWHTRAVSVLFMVGVLSLQNRSVFMGDGGDNVIHLMALYLVLTRCAQVWSLDARRAARRRPGRDGPAGPLLWAVLGLVLLYAAVTGRLGAGWLAGFAALWVLQALWWTVERHDPDGAGRATLDVLANLVHNAALLVIMAEVCLIYATAGWYKIQGSRWQDGTALYYPLGLDYFTPWPGLSGLLAGSGTLVMLLTYGTVAVQVAFPFTLLNRRVKNALLAVMMLEHAGIAVLLGLPFFSLAMIAADAVFLPTGFLLWLGARAASVRGMLPGRRPATAGTDLAPEPGGPEHPGPAPAPEPDPEHPGPAPAPLPEPRPEPRPGTGGGGPAAVEQPSAGTS
ncbi:HTTM domain-containing protein [Streptomyces sp. SMC 277]|uniref:HTTM domain-containing protein n=1 Tax=Streptomyces antimicrobicus TaxID=2883108 RepID=A0ABS8B5M5_9ACTN|nr:HTTM domain-containing protein [Streptomyces antimicrobicus]MCB5179881.1 HTTM domain-containing protein [Streptomyces antimicrobicus]